MGQMGMFGHVPSPDEVAAKAFAMDRGMQQQWSWPAYCCGLSDAGTADAYVARLVVAACQGESSHNADPAFRGELEEMYDPYDEIEKLRDFVRELHAAYVSSVNDYEDECERSACESSEWYMLQKLPEISDACNYARHCFDEQLRELGFKVP